MIIRPITTAEKAEEVVQLEVATWEMDPVSAVPSHLLLAVAKNGGLLLGAYEDERLIGFTFGWLGTTEAAEARPAAGWLKLCSHMTGVLSEYRDQGVGYRLKLAQREWAIQRGLDLVTWTFDPLESRNANLNVRRLGVTCRTYLRNHYGAMLEAVNAGIESDRFHVNWRITSERVRQRVDPPGAPALTAPTPQAPTRASAGAQLLNPATMGSDGLPRPAERPAEPASPRLLVEIPADVQTIRRSDMGLAAAWRLHTRALFEPAFAAGYQVAEFIYEPDPSFPRSFYLLERADED